MNKFEQKKKSSETNYPDIINIINMIIYLDNAHNLTYR